MSALFNFHSFLTVVLLVICTCTFLKMQFPTFLEQKTGEKFLGTPGAWRNGAPSSHIHGRTNMNLMSGPHHECERREHYSLYSRRTFRGFFWKAARIGERLSPWVAAGCFTMGVSIVFF